MIARRLAVQLLTGFLLLALAGTVAAALVAGGLTRAVIACAVLLFALAGALAVVMRRTFSRPLALLTSAGQRLTEGEVGATGPPAEVPDLTELASALNTMAVSMRDHLDEAVEERERGRQILDAMDDGVLLLDGGGRLLVANRAARSWFGIGDDLRPGLPAGQVIDSPALTALVAQASAGAGPATATIQAAAPASLPLAARAIPVTAAGTAGRVVVTLRDESASSSIDALRRDFVTNASLELRTPVAALRTNAETVLERLRDEPGPAGRAAARLHRDAERLGLLVDGLLELSRADQGVRKRHPVDLVQLGKEVVQTYAERADERRIYLRADLTPGVAIRGDAAQLDQLLSNLVDNALRYTPAGGMVWLRVRNEGTAAIVEVEDSGRGIPSVDLPRVFERFYRVDKSRASQTGGAGLGLAIVKHVAEAHGGHVGIDSTLGKGTTVRVTFPAQSG